MEIRWEVADYDWLRAFDVLQQYYSEHNIIAVTRDYIADGFQLSGWVNNQRTKYKTGKLASWKIEKLNAIDFPWIVNHDNWKIGFEHAKQYLSQNGNLKVSQTFVTSDGYSLGFWLATQRQQHSKGNLDVHRIELLEAIGLIWEPQEHAWNQSYAEAQKYYEKHGCMDFSAVYVSESGFKLGEWVRGQTRLFLKGTLKPERQSLLEKVGINFNSLRDKPRKI